MTLSRYKRLVLVLSTCVAAVCVFATSASATHNRATQLSWSSGAAQNEVNFTIDFVARRSYYGSPGAGDVIEDPVLEFGDGQWVVPTLTVIEVEDDIIYTHGQVNHTYADAGPYTATMGSCCRLSSSSGHVSNGDLSYQVHTLVNPSKANSSPAISVAPVVFCPIAGSCSFAFAGSGADPGNHLQWRFATPAETGDTFFVQPGPPFAPNAATIDSTLGRITWDTTGATTSSDGLPSLYSTQVVAEEVNSQGEVVSDAAADFFISLDDEHTEQPECEDTDSNGTVDNDEDGLCDNWETDGIDSDHDHDPDFRLPVSADPNRPDIFVEIDYMPGREPQPAALADVVTAFAKHDVALHLLVDDEIPFTDFIAFGSGCSPCDPDTSDFDTIKHVYFGTAGDRSASNWLARREARRYVFHYAIWANKLLGAGSSSGKAELPGNDLVITLGDASWRTPKLFGSGPPKPRDESGTFMHELGHNLALRHGGGDGVNCKPNYLSVMSYTRQTTGLITAQLDYSDAVLPTLDESDLNETLGIQGPSGAQVVHGPGDDWVSNSTGPIDWNRTGGIQSSVSADVNYISSVSRCDSPTPGDSLVGFDDWDNLGLAFQATADFGDGVHSSVFLQEPEVAAEDFADEDTDGDGVPNIQDNCPTVPGDPNDGGCPPLPSTDPPGAAAAAAPSAPGARPGPPSTRLRKARIKARGKSARFTFAGPDGVSGIGFQCKLDGKPFRPCTSPKVYRGLTPGSHSFQVRAVDALGQVDSTPVIRRFQIPKGDGAG